MKIEWISDRSSSGSTNPTVDFANATDRFQNRWRRGQRLILAFSPGLSFVSALLDCLRCGVVAVPVPMPRRGYTVQVFRHIFDDVQAAGILVDPQDFNGISALLGKEFDGRVHSYSDAHNFEFPADLRTPNRSNEHAFIQYTSGSTSLPKGVCITRSNLVANLELIQDRFHFDGKATMVSWLPHHHDMGLVGGILAPLYAGSSLKLMAPSTFVKSPTTWIRAIAECVEGHVIAGGPNFAFQHCVDRAKLDVESGLDLSRWETAFIGAEPISPDVLTNFEFKFGPSGFRPDAFYSCYGLAESTLYVTGYTSPKSLNVSLSELAKGRFVVAKPDEGQVRKILPSGLNEIERIQIICPHELVPLKDGFVGEIAISGASVAVNGTSRGELLEASQALPFDSKKQYFRTGDLGVIFDDKLFITGRIKNSLIVGGQNIYASDIERIVNASDSRIGASLAFSCNHLPGSETTVLYCEIERKVRHELLGEDRHTDLQALYWSICSALTDALGFKPDHVRFGPPGVVPMTTSGKLNYGLAKREFGALPLLTRSKKFSSSICTEGNDV